MKTLTELQQIALLCKFGRFTTTKARKYAFEPKAGNETAFGLTPKTWVVSETLTDLITDLMGVLVEDA